MKIIKWVLIGVVLFITLIFILGQVSGMMISKLETTQESGNGDLTLTSLYSMHVNSVLYQDEHASFSGLCTYSKDDFEAIANGRGHSCNDSVGSWAAEVEISANKFACIDSTLTEAVMTQASIGSGTSCLSSQSSYINEDKAPTETPTYFDEPAQKESVLQAARKLGLTDSPTSCLSALFIDGTNDVMDEGDHIAALYEVSETHKGSCGNGSGESSSLGFVYIDFTTGKAEVR